MVKFKKLELVEQKLPEHTYWFLVCLKQKYAKRFIETGAIRFGKPREWKDIYDNTLRGDRFEGVYASMKENNKECDEFLRTLRPNPYSAVIDGTKYYVSDDVLEMRAYCMYGLHDVNMHLIEMSSDNHTLHIGGVIPFSYFKDLFPDWTKERYEANPNDDERPAVLLITPDKFHELVVSKLKYLGVWESEFLFKPISYFDYTARGFMLQPFGNELFNKHIIYKEQSEVRIVVDTRREFVRELFDKTDGVIHLGKIDPQVAFISDFYFEDVQIEIRDNKLYYSLATPIEIPIEMNMLG